jgi:hypothetical protein
MDVAVFPAWAPKEIRDLLTAKGQEPTLAVIQITNTSYRIFDR